MYPRAKNEITAIGKEIQIIMRRAFLNVLKNSLSSPAPSSSVSFGKNAVEIATPIKFTGIWWSDDAWLNERTAPAPIRDERLVLTMAFT